MSDVQAIFPALAKVQVALAKAGVLKESHNKQQNYHYRGIDNVMDAFSTPLAEAKVLTVPSYRETQRHMLTTSKGTEMVVVTTELTLTFLSLEDGSHVVAGPFPGEASDTLDKATSKAKSVAYRNAMLLTFTCPLGPAMDPEASDDPNSEDGDADSWATKIAEAADKDGLDKIAEELKAAEGIEPRELRNIRALWAKRVKEVQS